MSIDIVEMDDQVSDGMAELGYGSNGDGVEEDQDEGDGRPT